MTFTLSYPPSSNRYWRHWRGRMVISAAARSYRQQAAAMALQAGVRPLAGPVAVRLDVFRPARRGDLDNSIKVLLDSLRGVAYGDDCQIVSIVARRFDDRHNPRVVVAVEPAQAAGTTPTPTPTPAPSPIVQPSLF